MKQLLIVAAMATAGSALLTSDAFAFHRHHRRCCTPQPTCCAPAPTCCAPTSSCAPSPATTTPQPDAAPAPPPQANNTNGYQSYSYEPGANVPPSPTPMIVPQRTVRQTRSFYDEIRADRKVRGTLSQ